MLWSGKEVNCESQSEKALCAKAFNPFGVNRQIYRLGICLFLRQVNLGTNLSELTVQSLPMYVANAA